MAKKKKVKKKAKKKVKAKVLRKIEILVSKVWNILFKNSDNKFFFINLFNS